MTRLTICVILEDMRARPAWKWEEFKETAARRMPARLYATLNPRGEFVINIKTYIQLNEPEAVVLLYDRDTRTIGIRPSRTEIPNAIFVHTRHERYNRVIRSKPFLIANEIEITRTIQFPTAVIDLEGVLILNLKESVTAAHMPRKPSKR